jgi:hypothetical protein
MTATEHGHGRAIALATIVAALFILIPQPAFAQEKPQVQTPIGAFTIASVMLADEFPVGCTPPAYRGAGSCNRPTGGRRMLIIHITNPSAARDADFTDPIEVDMKAVKIVAEDGGKWVLGLRQWSLGRGIHMVYTGKGSPKSVELTWPGNPPITLKPSDGS